jgi:hypothetical protein
MGQPTSRRRARARGALQITDRDRLLLAFAAEHRFVTAAQIAVVIDATVAAADTRLRGLADDGYLRREQKLYGAPASYRATAAGLRAVASDLPTPRPLNLATYGHDEGLAWLMLAARRGRFGPLSSMVSERRMRSEDGRRPDGGSPHGVPLGGVGPGGRERLHYPDLVVTTASGHRVAFELELTTKDPDRRERILAAYAADRRIDAVIYLVPDAAKGRAIERSAARVGISDLVRVQRVRLHGSAPAPPSGRTIARGHGTVTEGSRGRRRPPAIEPPSGESGR